jgi:hypothetical protein
MFAIDPRQRIIAIDALCHPYFEKVLASIKHLSCPIPAA